MSQDTICLHIGCGLAAAEGWKNFDASPSLKIAQIPVFGRLLISVIKGPNWPQSVLYGDVIKGLNIPAGSCELIYAAHVLEHLSLVDFHTVMNRVHSYLKPGGVFRAIVPDLESYVKTYLAERADTSLAAQAAPKFMETSWIGHQGSRSNLLQRLREALANSRHQWMWDEPSLTHAFTQHGFQDVRRCVYGEWLDQRFQAVEHEVHYKDAFCIQGTKAQ